MFVRHYRHDFLNILQVAGGLAQLHKTERLLAFIQQASAEVSNSVILSTAATAALLIVLESFAKLTAIIFYRLRVSCRLSPATPGFTGDLNGDFILSAKNKRLYCLSLP